MQPTIGRIVHYRLTRADITESNRQKVDSRAHYSDNNKTGVQVHEGNQHHAGDVVPLIIVRVWDAEYNPENHVCCDYTAGQDGEPEWFYPSSEYGVNGQALLDGNCQLWITSAPQGVFNGAWDWPPVVNNLTAGVGSGQVSDYWPPPISLRQGVSTWDVL